ncbi:MAG: hypothetical protein P4L64_11130 [Caulobacteraceae bacterium]|nr:hypothetical protein [Caulobacteraceae bacterium]
MSQNVLTNTTTPPLAGSTAISVLNQAVDSLAKWFSGSATPTASAAGLSDLKGFVWHDTATNTLKVMNQAGSTWIVVGYFDETYNTFTPHVNAAATFAADTGSAANTYAFAMTPAWTAYNLGGVFFASVAHGNTGASVGNVNGLGAKAIVRRDGSALTGGELVAGTYYPFLYDGTSIRMLTPPPQAAAFTPTQALFQNQQASGSGPGESLSGGVWNRRTLNTTAFSNIAGASISSNVITLPAGTYQVWGLGPFGSASALQGRSRLRDTTNNVTLASGPQIGTGNGNSYWVSEFHGLFTLTGAATIEMQTCPTIGSGGGLSSSTGDVEIYASLMFNKSA